jgi:hypothetical protein
MTNSLLEHFRKQVPVVFVTEIARLQPQIYQEAAASAYRDPRWTEAEGRSLIGDFERAIFENVTRKAARTSGLDAQDVDHVGGNCSCVHVYAGNIALTTHRVPEPGYFVRQCESRKQNAAVNKFLDGYVLKGSLSAPLPVLGRADQIRLYILHGTRLMASGDRESFVQLAAPDSELGKYQWLCSFGELQQAYLADSRENNAGGGEDGLKKQLPKLRKFKKSDEAGQ